MDKLISKLREAIFKPVVSPDKAQRWVDHFLHSSPLDQEVLLEEAGSERIDWIIKQLDSTTLETLLAAFTQIIHTLEGVFNCTVYDEGIHYERIQASIMLIKIRQLDAAKRKSLLEILIYRLSESSWAFDFLHLANAFRTVGDPALRTPIKTLNLVSRILRSVLDNPSIVPLKAVSNLDSFSKDVLTKVLRNRLSVAQDRVQNPVNILHRALYSLRAYAFLYDAVTEGTYGKTIWEETLQTWKEELSKRLSPNEVAAKLRPFLTEVP